MVDQNRRIYKYLIFVHLRVCMIATPLEAAAGPLGWDRAGLQ